MKFLVFLACILLSACSSIPKELENALAYGTIQELNNLNPEIEKDLFIRLYEKPIHREGCFKETHGVCQYKYFLSVSTFDEHPETNLYELKNIGEAITINWLKEDTIDSAEISFIFNKYTKEALLNNTDLKNEQNKVIIKVTPTSISETTVKQQ